MSLLIKLMGEIMPLTLNDVLELERRGLGDSDLTADEYSELMNRVLETALPELPWRDLPTPEAQLLCVAVFKETFKKLKMDMIFRGVSFN